MSLIYLVSNVVGQGFEGDLKGVTYPLPCRGTNQARRNGVAFCARAMWKTGVQGCCAVGISAPLFPNLWHLGGRFMAFYHEEAEHATSTPDFPGCIEVTPNLMASRKPGRVQGRAPTRCAFLLRQLARRVFQ
jgi:hypothetical protein